MASRFRIFRRVIIVDPEKVTKITQATCVLHNYLIISEQKSSQQDHLYCPSNYVDQEDDSGHFIPGQWREEDRSSALADNIRLAGNRASSSAITVREQFCTYFFVLLLSGAWRFCFCGPG